VVTTDVGGNAEVVSDPRLGTVVPFGDRTRLAEAIAEALERDWDRDAIVAHAEANSWERRTRTLIDELTLVSARGLRPESRSGGSSARPLLRS
jgi:glycosyltransferase involved in cell wall biosynthesis